MVTTEETPLLDVSVHAILLAIHSLVSSTVENAGVVTQFRMEVPSHQVDSETAICFAVATARSTAEPEIDWMSTRRDTLEQRLPPWS
jgi:phage-related protein